MQITLGGITFEFEEVAALWRRLLGVARRKRSCLAEVDQERLAVALANAVMFLLNDRLADGVGKGGWGKSDCAYMTALYGSETGSRVHESVMTTTVAVLALKSYHRLVMGSSDEVARTRVSAMWDVVQEELDEYLRGRWDESTGRGGVLTVGMDGLTALTPRYRHTGWLLELWLALPKYSHRTRKTIERLFNDFESQKWGEEKVATPVAAHVALSYALGNKSISSVTDAGRAEHLLAELEQLIEAKYLPRINGWTAGLSVEGGRQLYTLFTLSDMSHAWKSRRSTLPATMQAALSESLSARWQAGGGGLARSPGGPADVNVCCLAASALMRKPTLTRDESKALSAVLGFLVSHMADGLDILARDAYSWTVAYLVKDVAGELRG